ncbi:hypothetical protein [[Mycoplasma] anseris]|nr:hypothetical protein [[Mycoplasma] anseris]
MNEKINLYDYINKYVKIDLINGEWYEGYLVKHRDNKNLFQILSINEGEINFKIDAITKMSIKKEIGRFIMRLDFNADNIYYKEEK